MTCSIVQIPGGGVAIVKHANPRYPAVRILSEDARGDAAL